MTCSIRNNIFIATTFVLVFAGACKKKDKDPKTIGAKANVALENTVADLHLTPDTTLTAYGMKIVYVYVSESIDESSGANSGKTFKVYINPQCGDKTDTGTGDDIVTCDISGADEVVDEYFNLLRSSDEVNDDLNSQKRSIEIEVPSDSNEKAIATIRYARIEFAGANPKKAKNLLWATETTGEQEIDGGSTHTTKLEEPIEVEAGDSITFSLAYDYSDAVRNVEDAPDDAECADEDDGSYTCFFPPEFTASASKD